MMGEIAFDDGVAHALNSLLNDRLALLAGAGLSMAPPSSLPSAAALAAVAKQKYDAMYGAARAPLAEGVEDQAEFFFQRGELATVYFRTLVDQNAFAGQPNPGHFAIADLLLVRAIQTGVTTNVDTLVETAGQLLLGEIGAGIDGHGVAALSPDVSPLLKLHGCRMRDFGNMVWAPGQLGVDPVASRIANSTLWLNARLLDRDLLIVGYWTDWDYLNAILTATLGAVTPARVIVVDPADGAMFAAKAPALFALGQRASTTFQHVRASGSDFVDSLRREFSRSFVRRVLHSGAADFVAQTGANPDPAWMEPPDLDNTMLWQVRRDLEGRIPNEPARERNPAPETLVGLTLLQLQAAGALADGAHWSLNGKRVRILRTVNKLLHRVQAEFEREVAPVVAPDIVIAIGAEAQALPANIARVESQATIARGSRSQWMTRPEALQELGL
jgi:hypothetical protein